MPKVFEKVTGLRCSFCGKGKDETERLIAGPGVYICSDCVALCDDIIADGRRGASGPEAAARRCPDVLAAGQVYRLRFHHADAGPTALDFPLPLGTVGVQVSVVRTDQPWTGPCPCCGAWSLPAAERAACRQCGQPLPDAGPPSSES